MKVLIITYYWPPAGGSGVQRWLKFVKYFRDFGIEPIIYTVQDAQYAILDDSLEKDIPEGIEIVRKPIKEPNQLFSLFGSKKKKTSAGFLDPNPSLFGRIVQYVRANYFIPDARKFWVKPSITFLSSYLKKRSFDAILTTGPPHSMHLIGLGLKEKLNIKWLADFRDPWTDIDYFHHLPLSERSKRKHYHLEKEVLQKADLITVVGKTMKEKYGLYNNQVEVITNGFDTITDSEEVPLDQKFSLVHIGLMNSDRNHTVLWESLQELCEENDEFSNDLQLKFVGRLADNVVSSIEKYQLKPFVKFINYLPHQEVVQYQKSAQILLLSVNNVPSAKGIITGKIFEYLQVKRPILAIAPIDGDLGEIINKTNSGFVIDFNDKEGLKKVILKLYKQYKSGILKVDSKNIQQYHRKELTAKLAQLLKESFA